MPFTVRKGCFYEFHRSRVTSSPGSPVSEATIKSHVPMGPEISEQHAISQVRSGKDVYTPFRFDAYKLACSAYGGKKPLWEGAEQEDFYPHYHPGGIHAEGNWERHASQGRPIAEGAPGHVFWGNAGELLERSEEKGKKALKQT
ncbi:MAG TPA: hypothetical protein VMD77_10260 [Candidatus Baltobacteraceae bacterium]|nr:hypothetical protein [Candidatus Baltobacteraceae bacterium]